MWCWVDLGYYLLLDEKMCNRLLIFLESNNHQVLCTDAVECNMECLLGLYRCFLLFLVEAACSSYHCDLIRGVFQLIGQQGR